MFFEATMHEAKFEINKKIMKNYNWEYFKAQINQKLSEPETKKSIVKRKIDVEPVLDL